MSDDVTTHSECCLPLFPRFEHSEHSSLLPPAYERGPDSLCVMGTQHITHPYTIEFSTCQSHAPIIHSPTVIGGRNRRDVRPAVGRVRWSG